MPSGGARVGSGPKRKPGPRNANGRMQRSQKTATCACGAAKHEKAKQCRHCCDQARAIKPKPCAFCGTSFVGPKTVCSPQCGRSRVEWNWIAMRLDESEKSVRLRVRRRRGSATRVARGWKAIKGRWIGVCERDGWACWICGNPINRDLPTNHRMAGTSDHVIALKDGGSDEDGNLRAAHRSCNSRRFRGWHPTKETTCQA
jgi:hypothetical protein